MIKHKTDLRILIIEDNDGDFLLIEDYLAEAIENAQAQHVKSFNEAAVLLAEHVYDIILLDLTLPDKSGHDLIKGIIEISEDASVIVLTGYSDMEFSVQSISFGVSDYLLKNDLNSLMLYKSIIYCIERKKRMQQIKESEKRYSELFRLSPQPIWICELETFCFVQVNKAAVDLYEYSEEEFLNMTIFDMRPQEEVQFLKRALAHPDRGGIVMGKFLHLTKSKKLLEVEVNSNFVLINNKQYRLAIMKDVTEKNRMEHQITKAIIRTQENERYEIGAELHDNVCQILASTHIYLGMLSKSIKQEEIPLFHQCRQYIDLATQEIRNLSHRLAPAFF